MCMKLRPAQIRAKKLTYGSFKTHTKVILQKPTGAGKTYTAAAIANDAVMAGRRVLFLVDQTNLIEQTLKSMKQVIKVPIGVIWKRHIETFYDRRMQIAMQQTLVRRIQSGDWVCDPEEKVLIIVDEAHVEYAVVAMLAGLYPQAMFLGLTATPFSRGMGKFWQDLVVGATYTELLEQGFLAPLRVFSPERVDLSGLSRNKDGDISDKAASEILRTKLAGEIVSKWQQHAEGRKSLYFVPRVSDAKFVAEKFNAAGIPAADINGYTGEGKDERDKEVLAQYESGEILVLVQVEKMVKGTDIPNIGCIGLCRVSMSLKYHLQSIGRGMRVCDEYDDCIVIDQAGNFHELGWPQDIDTMEHKLDTDDKCEMDRNRAELEDRIRTCTGTLEDGSKCGAAIEARAKVCLSCGHKPKRPIQIKWDEAVELVEMTRTQMTRAKGGVDAAMLFYQHLLWFKEHQKYKDDWIDRNFKKQYGVSAKVFRGFSLTPEPPDEVAKKWFANLQQRKQFGSRRWKRSTAH